MVPAEDEPEEWKTPWKANAAHAAAAPKPAMAPSSQLVAVSRFACPFMNRTTAT